MPHKRNRRNLGAGAGPPLGIRGTSSWRTWGAAHLAASGGIMSFRGALQRDFQRSWDFFQTKTKVHWTAYIWDKLRFFG